MLTEASQMANPDPGTPIPATVGTTPVTQQVTEQPAMFRPGLQMLPLGLLVLIIGVVLLILVGQLHGASAF